MNPARRDLPEFVRVERGKRVALVHPDFISYLADALLAGQGVQPASVEGRGQLQSVPTPHGDVLIRKCLRGGMAARVLKETYLLDNRPLKELKVHGHAWRSGVPTVMPVGAMWERSGLFYRGAYATLRADAVDLLHYLQSDSNPDPALLAACGRAIRAMHQAGIYHADLQTKNVLVSGGEALIIDFDGARVLGEISRVMGENNLARLRRSFVKRSLNLSAFEAIADAYIHLAEQETFQHRDTESTEDKR